jgi:hypothetical protein
MRAWLKDILSFIGLLLGAILLIALTLGRSLLEFVLGREMDRFPEGVKTVMAWVGGASILIIVGVCARKAWREMRRPVAWNRKDRERSQLEDEWL